ncbi:hypothetical protein ASE12_02675 [Aeromicrobium sp. Root236]|uniref:hypothetical protein n=1 Tax=Aeromicrobium sp. Root236 TaxID=1736498 RepID=UPI0006F2A688|nr:hypothetical protein [Aeromicrobium sp. Root236]KRC63765.1 hypothetical protein ASE12_02675 [Aeromicrobium sp. Root236]
MTDQQVTTRHEAPPVVRSLDITAKAGLLVLLAIALMFPDLGHMRGKAAGLRAVTYPLLAFSVPALWYVFWRDRASFPWVADLLVTVTCFTDTLGNRMNMYDTIVWFDDWIHFMNTGLLTAGVILLTLHRTATLGATIERALAFGATVAIGWEIAEYYAFISTSSERRGAYTDTLGDLFLGTSGSVVAALVVHRLWQMGRLASAAPQLEPLRA